MALFRRRRDPSLPLPASTTSESAPREQPRPRVRWEHADLTFVWMHQLSLVWRVHEQAEETLWRGPFNDNSDEVMTEALSAMNRELARLVVDEGWDVFRVSDVPSANSYVRHLRRPSQQSEVHPALRLAGAWAGEPPLALCRIAWDFDQGVNHLVPEPYGVLTPASAEWGPVETLCGERLGRTHYGAPTGAPSWQFSSKFFGGDDLPDCRECVDRFAWGNPEILTSTFDELASLAPDGQRCLDLRLILYRRR